MNERLPFELRSMTKHLKEHAITRGGCVYFLVEGDAVLYVGKTKNLSVRIGQHLKDRKSFDRVFYLWAPESLLDEVESTFIWALNPKLNRKLGYFPSRPNRILTRFNASHLVFEDFSLRDRMRMYAPCGI